MVAQQVPEFVNDVANQAKDTFGDDAFSQKSFFSGVANPQLGLGNILQRPLLSSGRSCRFQYDDDGYGTEAQQVSRSSTSGKVQAGRSAMEEGQQVGEGL